MVIDPNLVANKVENIPTQLAPEDNMSLGLIELSGLILTAPEPYRSQLQACYITLSDAILQYFAIAVERDKLLLQLIENVKMDTTYLAFDLEATQRERDLLKQIIDNQ